jgi:TonB family protein
MRRELFPLIALLLLSTSVAVARENKGRCPFTPPKSLLGPVKVTPPTTPPASGGQYAGTVVLMVVISDTGYVCDAQVVRGVEKALDKTAVKNARQWHLEPVRTKEGRSVPVVARVDVNYWLKDRKFIPAPGAPVVSRRKLGTRNSKFRN